MSKKRKKCFECSYRFAQCEVLAQLLAKDWRKRLTAVVELAQDAIEEEAPGDMGRIMAMYQFEAELVDIIRDAQRGSRAQAKSPATRTSTRPSPTPSRSGSKRAQAPRRQSRKRPLEQLQ